MNLIRQSADPLLQLADYQGMDIFVPGAREEFRGARLRSHGFESFDDAVPFTGCKDTDALERPREGLGTADVGVHEAPVEMERAGESFKDLRRLRFEPSAPQLHRLLAALDDA